MTAGNLRLVESSTGTKSKKRPSVAKGTTLEDGTSKAQKKAVGDSAQALTGAAKAPRASSVRPKSTKTKAAVKRAAIAAELMTAPVVCCSKESPLNIAAQLMWENDVGAVVVVDDAGKPVGMITDRDVCMAAYTRGIALHAATVESALSRACISCSEDTPVAEVRELMAVAQVRRIPVTGEGGVLVGLIGFSNLLSEASAPLPKSRKRGSSPAELVQMFSALHAAPAQPRASASH